MNKSQKLFNHAQLVIPGGVNSPVRAFKSVGGTPLFFQRGKGALVWDADGNSYIDYVGSWGPLICGHAQPDVIKAVQQAAERGLSFGAPTEAEIEMADLLRKLVPSLYDLFATKQIVNDVTNPATEISLTEAQELYGEEAEAEDIAASSPSPTPF